MSNLHLKFLSKAHLIAKKQYGKTFPNPSVGCVIVKNNNIIATGVTASAGRPHAEEIALKKAGKDSIGATLYVTLEPCFHKSDYGSCTDQIINSGIKKIYIADFDPDPRTYNKSIKKLKKNNIIVDVGKTKEKTFLLNKFFFESLNNNRPFIKVKMAISNDEKIAWSDYSSKWISNSKSRKYAHKLRYLSQAILTTSKTIRKDNPRFTVRKNKKIIKYMPVIIIDKSLKIPLNCHIIKNASKREIIIFTLNSGKKLLKLKSLGCKIFIIKSLNKDGNFNLSQIMKKIFSLNINNLLVEAGGIFFTELLKKKLIDEIHIFKAPFCIGKSGKPMIMGKNIIKKLFVENSKNSYGKDIYQHLTLKK